jgi:hypothetical protein
MQLPARVKRLKNGRSRLSRVRGWASPWASRPVLAILVRGSPFHLTKCILHIFKPIIRPNVAFLLLPAPVCAAYSEQAQLLGLRLGLPAGGCGDHCTRLPAVPVPADQMHFIYSKTHVSPDCCLPVATCAVCAVSSEQAQLLGLRLGLPAGVVAITHMCKARAAHTDTLFYFILHILNNFITIYAARRGMEAWRGLLAGARRKAWTSS